MEDSTFVTDRKIEKLVLTISFLNVGATPTVMSRPIRACSHNQVCATSQLVVELNCSDDLFVLQLRLPQ